MPTFLSPITVHLMTMLSAFAAIRKNDQDALTAALDAGSDPNEKEGNAWTLLMFAVYCSRLHMVDVLLSRGGNVHLKDHHGQTALHYAAHYAAVECCSDIFTAIFSGAGPRAMNIPTERGWTPLHFLAYNGSAEQMAFALSHPGIDVSIRNGEGRTALEVARMPRIRSVLQAYGKEEARWQPLRFAWIKLLMIPTRP